MPRLADHEARRGAIVEGLWRVIRHSGIHVVSVRSVAAEVGISPTALRYYFATQDELLEFAMLEVVDRVAARVRPLLQAPEGPESVEALLAELLPLDQARREEQLIYLAFVVRAQSTAGLRAVRDDTEQRLRQVVADAVGTLERAGHLGHGRDLDTEAARLFALLDGLAFQGALWPERHPSGQLRQIMHSHLDELRSAVDSRTAAGTGRSAPTAAGR